MFESIAATLAFVFFGWPLVLFLAFLVIGIGITFKDEDFWWPLFFIILPLVLLYFAGHISYPGWKALLAYVGYYLAVGIGWSFYKWVIFVRDLKKHVEAFIENSPTKGFNIDREYKSISWANMTSEQKGETLWGECLCLSDFSTTLESKEVKKLNLIPSLSTGKNRTRVISWIVYWPFSVINYVFERLIRDILDWVVDVLKGVYNAVAKQIMRSVKI